jgi:hypothetical protein
MAQFTTATNTATRPYRRVFLRGEFLWGIGVAVLFVTAVNVYASIFVENWFTPLLGKSHVPQDLTVLIVTLNHRKDSKLYEEALRNHQSYAQCHPGYDFLNAQSLITEKEKRVHP